MSSRSICELVECSHLINTGCYAFKNPGRDCPMGKMGFEKDNQIFQNVHHCHEMEEIYKCIYIHLVESVLSTKQYIEGIKSEIANNLSNEDQITLGFELSGMDDDRNE